MNVCIDTNILIYMANGSMSAEPIKQVSGYYASISKIEGLGFGNLKVNEAMRILEFFAAYQQLNLDDEIINQAINLKQTKKRSLGDAIIAATALVYDLPLWTANTKDFANIPGLKLFDVAELKA